MRETERKPMTVTMREAWKSEEERVRKSTAGVDRGKPYSYCTWRSDDESKRKRASMPSPMASPSTWIHDLAALRCACRNDRRIAADTPGTAHVA
jgi:hypothetical protein